MKCSDRASNAVCRPTRTDQHTDTDTEAGLVMEHADAAASHPEPPDNSFASSLKNTKLPSKGNSPSPPPVPASLPAQIGTSVLATTSAAASASPGTTQEAKPGVSFPSVSYVPKRTEPQHPSVPSWQPPKLVAKDIEPRFVLAPRARWSREDDAKLKNAYETIMQDAAPRNGSTRKGGRTFRDVAEFAFPDGKFSVQSCVARWRTLSLPEHSNGSWTHDEDQALKKLVEQHGSSCWVRIAKQMPSRTSKQCRERWSNHLKDGLRKGPFSKEEAEIVWELYAKWGTRWSLMTEYLPDRSDNSIKNFFHANKKTRMRQGKLGAVAQALHESSANKMSNTEPSTQLVKLPPMTLNAAPKTAPKVIYSGPVLQNKENQLPETSSSAKGARETQLSPPLCTTRAKEKATVQPNLRRKYRQRTNKKGHSPLRAKMVHRQDAIAHAPFANVPSVANTAFAVPSVSSRRNEDIAEASSAPMTRASSPKAQVNSEENSSHTSGTGTTPDVAAAASTVLSFAQTSTPKQAYSRHAFHPSTASSRNAPWAMPPPASYWNWTTHSPWAWSLPSLHQITPWRLSHPVHGGGWMVHSHDFISPTTLSHAATRYQTTHGPQPSMGSPGRTELPGIQCTFPTTVADPSKPIGQASQSNSSLPNFTFPDPAPPTSPFQSGENPSSSLSRPPSRRPLFIPTPPRNRCLSVRASHEGSQPWTPSLHQTAVTPPIQGKPFSFHSSDGLHPCTTPRHDISTLTGSSASNCAPASPWNGRRDGRRPLGGLGRALFTGISQEPISNTVLPPPIQDGAVGQQNWDRHPTSSIRTPCRGEGASTD